MDNEQVTKIEKRFRATQELGPNEPLIAYALRCLNGRISMSELSRRFGVPRSQIDRWIVDCGYRRVVKFVPAEPMVA